MSTSEAMENRKDAGTWTAMSGSLLLTFRELWAMRLTQGILIVSTLAWILLSFAMNLDVVEGSLAAMRIFGIESTPDQMVKDAATGEWVRQAVSLDSFVIGISTFVFGAAYFLGTLLGLFATMPLIGGFLEQGRIDLLLSKPLSRSRLLTGHLLGVWLTVLALSTYLIGAVWVAISVKTGIWNPSMLMSIPIIVMMFIFISVILAAHDQIEPVLSPTASKIYMTFYHVLPNFAEVVVIQAQLISTEAVKTWYPLISSVLFGSVVYGLGYYRFNRRDF
jgi:ABC-2 type transport system permease protein